MATHWITDFLQVIMGSFRVGGLLVSMPVFGVATLPNTVKIAFALGLGLIMRPFYGSIPMELFERNDFVLLMVARELGLGIFMGYCARFIFSAMSMALDFASMQMGFNMGSIFDPANNAQVSTLSQVGIVCGILFFFMNNFHHDLFLALVKSFEIFPIGLPDFNLAGMGANLVSFIQKAFELALRLSMPVMIVMLLIHVIMGIISKTAPQMNLFFNISFIVNVVTGLILVMLFFPKLIESTNVMNLFLKVHGYGLW